MIELIIKLDMVGMFVGSTKTIWISEPEMFRQQETKRQKLRQTKNLKTYKIKVLHFPFIKFSTS